MVAAAAHDMLLMREEEELLLPYNANAADNDNDGWMWGGEDNAYGHCRLFSSVRGLRRK